MPEEVGTSSGVSARRPRRVSFARGEERVVEKVREREREEGRREGRRRRKVMLFVWMELMMGGNDGIWIAR